ncbi:SoxR reducing system RseC family protein [bacterium]|nr:SoxR reducing system RseC family protein [bacterium]
MPEEIGRIVELLPEGEAKVKLERREGCASCGSKHTVNIFNYNGDVITADNPEGFTLGSLVTVEYDASGRVKASMIVFLFPVIILILGYFIGVLAAKLLGRGETLEELGVLFSLLSVIIYFGLVRIFGNYFKKRHEFKFEITKKAAPCVCKSTCEK